MLTEHNRAFKEWAAACQAMRDGRQILLIRKGGIREEGGIFTINDTEFFLMPTFEHQNAALLQAEFQPLLKENQSPPDIHSVVLDTYAVVDTILTTQDEVKVNAVSGEYIWNAEYVKQRFDFNPYDPLYLLILRVYRLKQPVTIPLLPEYVGCRSWVTLDRLISTAGATPSVPDAEFAKRRSELLKAIS